MPPCRRNRVNNEADPAFTVAVAHEVADLLPTLTARITDEIRQKKNNGDNGNRRNARRKQKPQTFSSASTPVEAENWIAHIEKIFEVLGCGDQFKARLATYKLEGDAHRWWRAYKQAKGGDAYVATLPWNDFRGIFFLQYFSYSEKEKCEREYKSIRQLPEETSIDFMKRFLRLAGFLGAKAGTQEKQAKHFKWGLNDFILDRILNTEFTDVAQVANAARNVEIFCEWPRNEGNNKRDRDDNHMSTVADMATKTGMEIMEGVVIDREVTNMVMAMTNGVLVLRGCGVTRISRFGANSMVVLMGHRARGDTQIMPHLSRVPFVGNFIRERRVTGLMVLALNVEKLDIWLKIVRKAANASCTILETLYMYDRGVFVLFDTGLTHSVVSIAFSKHLKYIKNKPYTKDKLGWNFEAFHLVAKSFPDVDNRHRIWHHVASLENVNGFLAVYTPNDDLIRTNFKQEGIIPKVMLHILEEFVLLLGRLSLNNEILRMEENPTEESRLGIFRSKEIFKGGVIRIHNDFVHDEAWNVFLDVAPGLHIWQSFNTLFGEEEWGIFLKKTGHRSGYLRKVLYESSIEAGMTKKATDTLDGGGMRQRLVSSHRFNIFYKWERQVLNEFPKTKKSSMKTSIVFRSCQER
nr:zinc finger, CCHC-type, retrotransposon Gag domain protein [Tanacetum cinerariifolium]